jgi:hypothetical protein
VIAALLASAAALLPGWPPTHVTLGLASQPGGAAHVHALHAGWRYQYLTGGANTDNGWATWNPDGSFVTKYVAESQAAHITPVFTYYQLLSSKPSGSNSSGGDESAKDLANLADAALMKAYYADLSLALIRANRAAQGKAVVFHIEPDLWGYLQQRARTDDASTLPAAVARSGAPRLSGLPDTAAGFAQAIVRLRDQLAPNVVLGYHLSTWGTKTDPVLQNPTPSTVDTLSARSARFYASLHARFDAIFSDPSDRDDGFKATVLHDGGRGRWTAGDYQRDRRWLAGVHRATHLPLVMWQIPLGNRGLSNTPGHYRDTHVQTLLGNAKVLRGYRDAGVVALLFGGGAEGTTSERTAVGLFARLAARYARRGPLRSAG